MAKKAQPLKLPSPKNANQTLPALHTVYVAGTGGGKTTAIKKLNLVPRGAQVVFFDPYENYCNGKFKGQNVQRFTEFAPFARALVAARAKNASFKCALVKPATMENLEMFAAIVWSVGDGLKKPLHVVIEELGSAAETSTKLNGRAGELWRGGRQFGLVVHSAFQRTQEVPKTVITQSPTWWVGGLSSLSDVNAIHKLRGVCPDALKALKTAAQNNGIAQYMLIKEGIDNIQMGELNCTK
ncbi:hypothetical protein GT360_07270 [Vibrio astriarenae]|uniref:Uncharacterized protein n=1 Tax=Vibrio astriarenae TaxID=1481923 RepID=A0A7Z2T303_9VIBR|nr:hypothetical protein [Vibrio astriarenae]QIA63330.1 hypothetical protein GT360_07270 [Vibrio astriarenae]